MTARHVQYEINGAVSREQWLYLEYMENDSNRKNDVYENVDLVKFV